MDISNKKGFGTIDVLFALGIMGLMIEPGLRPFLVAEMFHGAISLLIGDNNVR